jgi:LysR family transcriptional regulator, benzoate and cis,cis-muconate-responsive activator of ben and cat genes
MPHDDLRQLRYFLVVADERNFTRAAERLTVTQPALSRAVAALERSVGVTLLNRTSRGVEPTSAGKVLVDQARDIIRRVDAAIARTRMAALAPRPLQISCRGCDMVTLHELIRRYRGRYPGNQIEVVETDWFRQLDGLRTHESQIALLSGEFEHAGFASDVIATYERVALVSRRHRLATRQAVDRAELLPDPVVTWAGNSPAERAYWLGTEGAHGTVVAGPQVNDGEKLIAHVRLGTAVAFLPRPYVDHRGLPPDVVALKVSGLQPAKVRLVWAEDETSLAVTQFVRSATTGHPGERLTEVSG